MNTIKTGCNLAALIQEVNRTIDEYEDGLMLGLYRVSQAKLTDGSISDLGCKKSTAFASKAAYIEYGYCTPETKTSFIGLLGYIHGAVECFESFMNARVYKATDSEISYVEVGAESMDIHHQVLDGEYLTLKFSKVKSKAYSI